MMGLFRYRLDIWSFWRGDKFMAIAFVNPVAMTLCSLPAPSLDIPRLAAPTLHDECAVIPTQGGVAE